MAHLYELKEEYENLFAHMEDYVDENGEVKPEFAETLNSLTDDLTDKAISVAVFMKRLRATIEEYKAESNRITAEKKKLEREYTFYEKYLTKALQTAEIKNIKDVKANISFRTSAQLKIAENATIPTDYLVVKTEPNKTALKEAIKGGKTFEGITIEQCSNIQIK